MQVRAGVLHCALSQYDECCSVQARATGEEAFHLPTVAYTARASLRRHIRKRETHHLLDSPVTVTEVFQRLTQIRHTSLAVIEVVRLPAGAPAPTMPPRRLPPAPPTLR